MGKPNTPLINVLRQRCDAGQPPHALTLEGLRVLISEVDAIVAHYEAIIGERHTAARRANIAKAREVRAAKRDESGSSS